MDRVNFSSLSNYLFVHVGCPAVKDQELHRLHEEGFKILILDDVGIKPKEKIYFEYFHIAFGSLDTVSELINSVLKDSNLKLGHLFTLADGSIDFTNSLLRHFNRDPIYQAEFESIRNKYLVRKSLEEFGYHLPVCELVSPEAQIPEFKSGNFPLVVKPVDSMSSRSVRLVKNQAELVDACRLIRTESTEINADHGRVSVEDVYHMKRQALIESYIPGEEYSAEVLLVRRRILYIAVTSKITSGAPYFTEKGHLSGLFEPNAKIRHLVECLVSAAKYVTTLLHIEFKIAANGAINLIECNSRLGGDQICALTESAHGVHLLVWYLKSCVGLPVTETDRKNRCVALRYFITSEKSGVMVETASLFSGHAIDWWYRQGDRVALLNSERAARVGVIEVTFVNARQSQVFLQELMAQEQSLFRVDQKQPKKKATWTSSEAGLGEPAGGIGDLARRKLNSMVLAGIIAISLIFSLSLGLTLWEYQSQYIKLFGESLSASVQQQVAFQELLPLAYRVSRADARGWSNRIVVVDRDHKVLYSGIKDGLPCARVFSHIDPKDFEFKFPILSNGIPEGYVLIDRNVRRVSAIFGAFAFLLFALMFGVYAAVVRLVLPRAFSPIELGIGQLEKILSGLAIELDGLGENKFSQSIILMGYRKELDSIPVNVREMAELKKLTDQILKSLSRIQCQIDDREKLQGMVEQSKKSLEYSTFVTDMMAQVAHDIRSPLSALEVLGSSLDSISEDKRVLLRTAIRRISDIADGLSARKRQRRLATGSTSRSLASPKPKLSVHIEEASIGLLSALISEVISEKRLQYTDLKSNLDLDFKIESATYGLFALVQAGEFKRVISNLLDNSVEAAVGRCSIEVELRDQGESVLISVADTGKGIPSERLSQLGIKGNTFGKDFGTGLGLYHARRKVAEWKGELVIESQTGVGTKVTISLPKADAPDWFLSRLVIPQCGLISVLDDDESIHRIWEQRLSDFGLHVLDDRDGGETGLIHFSSTDQFVHSNIYKRPLHHLFLIDYELRGQDNTGLDVIEKLQLSGEDCVLVTSHWNEPHIRKRCERLGVRLLPKDLAPYVEIESV